MSVLLCPNGSLFCQLRRCRASTRLALVALFLAAGLSTPSRAEWNLSGFVSVAGRSTEAPRSWREGGFGVFVIGRGTDEVEVGVGRLSAQIDWLSDTGWTSRLTVHGQAGQGLGGDSQAESGPNLDQDLSVTELFVGRTVRRDSFDFDLRVGHFLLPTSRENVEPGWNSPFTMTFSAINTWIGEEARPTGVGARLGLGELFSTGRAVDLGIGAFGGNDSSGALLAWRGWVLGDRLVGVGEEVPLPDLESLRSGGAFSDQRSGGRFRETLPFGEDLDGEAGWYAFAVWRPAESISLRATHYDNRGDKALHESGSGFEYAWSTDFDLAGFDAAWRGFDIAAEWLDGHTGMGDPANVFVRADFEAWYALVSWSRGAWRLSARYDDFTTTDVDGASFDDNSGAGTAWTLALFWHPDASRRWRIGFEWLDVDALRPEALRSAISPQVGGEQLQLGIRFAL